jgi:hypothetical protein
LKKEIDDNEERDLEMKEVYIPNLLTEMKKQLTKEVVEAVNQINGGPVTEYKVRKMIGMARDTDIKEDIDNMAATLRKFMDEEIFSKITKNRKDLDNTIEFLERVDKLCNEH